MDFNDLNFNSFNELNSDFEGKKLIILGERHYLKSNYILQPELFIYLNKQFGIRHGIIEFGYAEAYLYNQILKTGEKSYLNYTSPGLSDYQLFFAGMEKLYEYYLTLDSGQKLLVHGFDLEREPGLSKVLYYLLPVESKDPAIASLREIINHRLETIGLERDNRE
ncbi:hypothetical protein DCC35_10870 [Mangrovivirga cuniculi]|uniref:Haem-binding uptake Tiki superfamily ChaN domain-containing protein n=2 Tax=Mangrovivirga cuniculi TaxID=2715131 RepID=A0A4D7JNY5_9BACT|nr:hypothetical protein DCC35_10870 [Mangrovivirga cuniculi]